MLNEAIVTLTRIGNVMVNNPPRNTGPRAMKKGFVVFRNEVGVITKGYISAGIYERAMREDGLMRIDNDTLFVRDDGPDDICSRNTTNEQERRFVTVIGEKRKNKQYVHRGDLSHHAKASFTNGALASASCQSRRSSLVGIFLGGVCT